MFDVSLLSQLREGNREAFNSLFRHYYPRVMAYVAAMVEQEVAEDVVQDVFLHVWENRKKLYAGEGFHSYLFQSAYTRCIDYYRKTQSADKYNLQIESAYLAGNISSDEMQKMEEWSNLSQDNKKILSEVTRLRVSYNMMYYKSSDHIEKALEKLNVKINRSNRFKLMRNVL